MKTETLRLINEWLYHNEKMREINKYLFNHTELYENQYMTDFEDDVFRFFAGKIARYSKDYNTLYKLLKEKDIKELNRIKIMERKF